MFAYISVTTENVSVASKALVAGNGSTLCSIVIPNLTSFNAFRHTRIWQRNSGYKSQALLGWHSRRLETFLSLTSCNALNIWILYTIACSNYSEKEVLTECTDIWSNSTLAVASGGSILKRSITFHASTWNVSSLHFWMGIIWLCYIVNSLNLIKRLFGKYVVSNMTEVFLFDVSIYPFDCLIQWWWFGGGDNSGEYQANLCKIKR